MKKATILLGRDWSVNRVYRDQPTQDVIEVVYPDIWGELGKELANRALSLRKYKLAAETTHAKYYEEE